MNSPVTPEKIAHYQILGLLGRGGMGVVYKARDTRLGRTVALKVLPEEKKDEQARRRFLLEAQSASALNHPNIVIIHDISQADGADFLVMEFVEGETLAELLRRDKLETRQAVDLALQVADALEAAHSANIIHRDLKPSNIMVTTKGRAKVMDFGLAKRVDAEARPEPALTTVDLVVSDPLTKPGVVIGTTGYMSPEQAEGLPLDRRSDIFSFGAVTYELLTRRRAFKGDSTIGTLMSLLRDEPLRPSLIVDELPAEVDDFIAQCLRKRPDDRYQEMSEVKQVLSEIRSIWFTAPTEQASRFSGVRPAVSRETASIAVLPFANLTGNKNDDYFSDGLAEDIINALSRSPGLKVAARSSAFQFRGSSVDLTRVGHQLKVSTVLEGGIRRAGNRLRVTVQLISVVEGHTLWSERYDREMTDIFAIQDEIAQAIVAQLKIEFSRDSGPQHLVKRFTNNLDAYHAYLEGRYHWNRSTPPELKLAKECFERAIELDENYALAHVGLATYYYTSSVLGLIPPRQSFSQGRESARRALALDNSLAEAHAALGVVSCVVDYDWRTGEQHFERAISLNPDSPFVRYLYAMWCLRPQRRLQEALFEMKKVLELDPLGALYRWLQAYLYYFLGDFDRSLELSRRTIEVEPHFYLAHWLVGVCQARKGLFVEAAEAHQKTVEIFGPAPIGLAVLASAYSLAGRTAEADQAFQNMERMTAVCYVPSVARAWVYEAKQDVDRMFEWMERAIEDRDPLALTLPIDPMFKPFHQDARYRALLERLRVPAQGQTSYS